MIKLIATDMDGTLLDENGKLPADFFEVLEELKKKNVKFVVASGRPYFTLYENFKPVSDELYFICDNGSCVVEESKEFQISAIDKEYVKEELSKLEEDKANLIKYIEENSELLNVTNGTIVPIELPDGISELAKNLINTAQRYLGVPYLWGGTTPSGFDCSGLMQYVFAKEKISIPRTSQEQQKASEPIDINDVEPGDLVFNKESDSTHVGMYIGNDKYIHAPHTGDVVKISTLSTSNMKYAGRVIDQ